MPFKTNRKLFRIGSSDAVTIPKAWIKAQKGNGKLTQDIVELTIEDDKIILVALD